MQIHHYDLPKSARWFRLRHCYYVTLTRAGLKRAIQLLQYSTERGLLIALLLVLRERGVGGSGCGIVCSFVRRVNLSFSPFTGKPSLWACAVSFFFPVAGVGLSAVPGKPCYCGGTRIALRGPLWDWCPGAPTSCPQAVSGRW